MTEFWESAYNGNAKMWGESPTDNAKTVLEILQKRKIDEVFIPGFGYGRNARVFYENGFCVSGIEISETAIKRARRNFGEDVTIHHGSVNDMPFDTAQYQSIYCYSLIHLLNAPNRKKLIHNCNMQLCPGGIMIFVALTVKDHRFGVGVKVEKNTYQSPNGLNLFFYDAETVEDEFGAFNILQATEINEPEKNPTEKHWMIICQKATTSEGF